MEKQQYIDRAEHALYKVYNRFSVVFDHGEGVKLYDTDGQEYLDFGAGIAVMGLGYSCDEVKNAVKEQMNKLPHISNLFYNEPAISAVRSFWPYPRWTRYSSPTAVPRPLRVR